MDSFLFMNFFANFSLGHWGTFFIWFTFCTALMSCIAYSCATLQFSRSLEKSATVAFFLHVFSLFWVISLLFFLIWKHRFDYYYVWRHSSTDLPWYYLISCFWEGQEGSFLLWMFWHAFLLVCIFRKKYVWKNGVFAVLMCIQTLLSAMLLGNFFQSMSLGSNPFILWKDTLDISIVGKIPSNFIPQEGNGLNPLLQNYWMVIHPPILFLGFASMSFPFAFCITGIFKKKFTQWVQPATFWVLFSLCTLGLGILMGAYWAYETLSFGGYWSWDPVENAVYIPWLILLAAMHTMMMVKKKKGVQTSSILVMFSFFLIWYSTFLTRSGILGNTSVHAFTDLGFSRQLIFYLFFFLGMIIWAIVRLQKNEIKKKIPSQGFVDQHSQWLFFAAFIFGLMGLQVLLPTSIPVYNRLLHLFGITSHLAPPVEAILFYAKYQLILSLFVLIGSSIAQFFWLKHQEKYLLKKVVLLVGIVTLGITWLILQSSDTFHWHYILLLMTGIYAVLMNIVTLIYLLRMRLLPSGGWVAHMGVAVMLLGILFSSGYSKILSKNESGLIYSKDFSKKMNTEHALLWMNDPKKIQNYTVRYAGKYFKALGYPGYIAKQDLKFQAPYFVAKHDIIHEKKIFFSKNSIVPIDIDHIYYKIIYQDIHGKTFTLYPQSQNHTQENLSAVPAIRCFWHKDLYTYISAITDPTQKKDWQIKTVLDIAKGKNFFINDYVATLLYIEKLDVLPNQEIVLSPQDLAVQAVIKIQGPIKDYIVTPVYIIQNKQVGQIPFIVEDLGIKIRLLNIYPTQQQYRLEISTTQRDYIVLKVIEKPWIGLFWIGGLLILIGFILAIFRRSQRF